MLENLMTGAKYRMPDYQYLNDRLLYIDYIDRNYTYEEAVVSPMDAYRYQGNLLGLFRLIGISDTLLPFALYLNGYTNPTNYDGKRLTFKIPKMPPIPSN